ncbi:MAG: type II toxin-antitoxin system Phd/YefM family antitoxin [Micrococcales bacterium]|nr:type II toxin-antitoxin system Phd/YefM family antitoxin [Micrococcales bacterium]
MTTLPLAEVRKSLSRLIDATVATHERVEVTRNGRREAVLLSADDFDGLMETLDVLSDADAVRELVQARREMAEGTWFSNDDVAAAMRQTGRL